MELPKGSFIASGPVIIEGEKVLLNKERKSDGITKWFFPGGEVEDFDKSLQEACHREAKEEIGIEIEIIKPLKTTMQKLEDGRIAILVHFLAKRHGEISLGKDVVDCQWHNINNLPDDCADNVYEIIDNYKKEMEHGLNELNESERIR